MAWVMETRTRLNISQELPQHERNEMIKNIMVNILYNILCVLILAKTTSIKLNIVIFFSPKSMIARWK